MAAPERGEQRRSRSPWPASPWSGSPWPGRPIPFRLEPTGDPTFDTRLVLERPLGGWLVVGYAAHALEHPRRPILRIIRDGAEAQLCVFPGPALGRATWLGLIPDDATSLELAAGPGLTIERVGRRSRAGIVWECFLRRPGHCMAALYAGARGQARRSRDILRGGIAVTRLRRFATWAARRAVPAHGPVPDLAVRCVVMAGRDDGQALARTMAALSRQTLPPAGTAVFRDGAADSAPGQAAWNPAWQPIDLLNGADALCVLRAGDVPAPDALALLAASLGDFDLSYGDEIGPDGEPRLKPDWSPDLALATGYVGRTSLLSRRLLERLPAGPLGDFAGAGLALDIGVAAGCRRARHVPRPLGRVAAPWPGVKRAQILDQALEVARSPARAMHRGDTLDLEWPLPRPAPLASIVIPSRDRLDLIEPACRGVLAGTDYPAIELIVVDNGSVDPGVLAFYKELASDSRVTILPHPEPFNFAAMVNAGVAVATGHVVVLLNNDVAVRGPGWLDAMVRQALRSDVGAVGAKLLFGDGKLQHSGVVVGLGGRAGHILRRRPADTPGHLGRLRVAHEVSAVTAACLAVARDKYQAVGGFDAETFPVDFNDVDFCLRLAAAGWKCMWTPAAELSHFESISRGPSIGAKRARFEAEAARFTQRWHDVIRHDPFYHPLLSLTTFGEDLE